MRIAHGRRRIAENLRCSAENAVTLTDVAVDNAGSIYISGNWQGTVVLDGPGGSDSKTSTNNNSFLTKYTANGSYAYTKVFDTSGDNGSFSGVHVATDNAGNVYVSGIFNGTVAFDGPGGSDDGTDAGGNGNNFLVSYRASTGTYNWKRVLETSPGGAIGEFTGYSSAAADSIGNVYTASDFAGTVIFDGPGGSDTQTAANNNNTAFLTSYQAFNPTAGPNNGDGNNDGIPDFEQPYVSSTLDSISNNWVVQQASSSCTNQSLFVTNPSSNAVQDSSYSYPAGLVNFTTNCVTPGFTATITLYFYGINPSGLVLRKYNTSTHTYTTITNATISQVTIGGQSVAKVTYQITDGSSLDQDATANGIIVDPVGLATAVVTAPNTGVGSPTNGNEKLLIAGVIALLTATFVYWKSRPIVYRNIRH